MSYSEKRKSLKKSRARSSRDQSTRIQWVGLGDAIDKRFKTVFVGALSKVEEAFSPLWGGDEIDEENMSSEQLKWYEIFLKLRDDIFDQGNEQKNRCARDLNRFRSRINIMVSKPEEEND